MRPKQIKYRTIKSFLAIFLFKTIAIIHTKEKDEKIVLASSIMIRSEVKSVGRGLAARTVSVLSFTCLPQTVQAFALQAEHFLP